MNNISMESWLPTWYYCLLCGERNDSKILECKRCGIPAFALLGKDVPPAGWAKAEICYESINSIDDEFENTRFVVKIKKVSGVQNAFPTDPFVAIKWEDWYPVSPPTPTEVEVKILNALVNQLHNDGWLDTLGNNGEPTNRSFWRRTM
jgi:hypothetical protein